MASRRCEELKGGKSKSGCQLTSLVGALALIVLTFTCTRAFDRYFSTCPPHFTSRHKETGSFSGRYGSFESVFGKGHGWPHQGYGTHIDLRIYVYEDWEITGLKELLMGRDHNIKPESCAKGQWGTQVKIHKLLRESSFRTLRKEEADLFFIPTYVKCVRMLGGLRDKEINQKFVQILQQMPYFKRSGGRDHMLVFPSGAGAHLFKDWAIYMNMSIFLSPEGDRTDKRGTSAFNTWKDVLIPGNVDDSKTAGVAASEELVRPLPLSERRFLANFLGRAQGKTGRLKLLELARRFPEKLNDAVGGPRIGF